VDRGALADERLDAPLPWDHIDTGIAKWWLKADLQKALEGITVPDCSHSGICTECGVCGDEFGENVVAEVPPLPVFQGHYKPDGRRTQRLRFRFTKDGKESFIGHLDTLRLLERACRRASLPVSMTRSPYSSRPRISTAMALPLGASSECEMMEIVLTETLVPEDVRARLAEELPAGMRLTDVEDMPVKYLNGRYMVRNHVDTNRRTLSFFLSTPARLLCSTRRACVFSLSLFCIAVASFFITRVGNDWPFGHN
jgi:hypothetical protein